MPEDTTEKPVTTETVETPAAKPAAKAVAKSEPEPPVAEFLKDRLERERLSTLKDAGIKLKRGQDPQEGIEEYKATRAAEAAELKASKAKIVEYEAAIEKLSHSTAAVKIFAQTEFEKLDDSQKAIVVASAGDDPNERLKTIAIMKAMKASAPAEPVAAAAKPIPAPAQTAPAAGAPAPSGTSQVVDVKAEHARLKESNPLTAAAYLLQNLNGFYKQP